MKPQLNWSKEQPVERGLYWIKAPDGTTAVFENTGGLTWPIGFQFSGPISPPVDPAAQSQPSKYAHLTSTGFVRKVRGNIKEKQTV